MEPTKLIGVALIVLGLLGLVYGGFSFTRETHQASIGPLELSVKEQQSVNVPTWAGGAAIAIGVLLVVVGGRKR